MSENITWFCEYLLECENSYVVVLFPNVSYDKNGEFTCDPYLTRVFWIDADGSSKEKEVKSEPATRYRDGGSTYIMTERGEICLPFGKARTLKSEKKVTEMAQMGKTQIETIPVLHNFFEKNEFSIMRKIGSP